MKRIHEETPQQARPKNYPINELLAKAAEAVVACGGKADVYFCLTCDGCGKRMYFDEPNKVFETGICECGHETVFTEGGFMLEVKL